MRARAALGGMVASAGILLVGWQIGMAATPQATTISSGGTTGSGSTSSSTNAPSAPVAPTTTSAAASAGDGTYTGRTVGTRFGDVQVQVALQGWRITDVTALHLTDADGRSVQISNRAAPILRDEVLASQSANVANVTGATYTSQAYLSSLQSALDQAGL